MTGAHPTQTEGAHPAYTEGAHLTRTEEVMGTVVSFTVRPGDLAGDAARAAIEDACAVLHRADAVFSTWNPDSPVSRLRRGEVTLAGLPAAAGTDAGADVGTDVAADVAEVLELCGRAKAMSRGWFDPWAMPGGLDPTGLVKGWAVERAAALLRRAGAAAALVNGGGDLAAFGSPGPTARAAARAAAGTVGPRAPWRVGIRHPWRADALACVVNVRAAIATSASYERGAHLIDPFTGQVSTRAASATVTGPSLALADALATALAVGGDDALAAVGEADGYEGYLIRPDGSEADTGGMQFTQ